MAIKDPAARKAYQLEWARRKREAQGAKVRKPSDNILDTVAVKRAIQGDKSINLNPEERALAVYALQTRGYSELETAELLGFGERTVVRYRAAGISNLMARIDSGEVEVSPSITELSY